MSIRDERQVLGWFLTFAIALPVNGLMKLRGVKRAMLPKKYYTGPDPIHEWDGMSYCVECDDDTMHMYVEWKDPGHEVTKECSRCRNTELLVDEGEVE